MMVFWTWEKNNGVCFIWPQFCCCCCVCACVRGDDTCVRRLPFSFHSETATVERLWYFPCVFCCLLLPSFVAHALCSVTSAVNWFSFNNASETQWLFLLVVFVFSSFKSNGTLDCSEALQIWEPVRIAVGLSNATMSAWCNVELQPVAENYAALLSVQLQLPVSIMEKSKNIYLINSIY